MDKEFMKAAINAARLADKGGGLPIGAVMVKDGKIIAEGRSLVWAHKDPTEHAETNCIRSACEKLDIIDLYGCTLYGTLEPCGMCVSASCWAGLDKIVFGAYREDIVGNEYELKDYSAESLALKTRRQNGQPIQISGGILREECKELMKNTHGWMR